MKVIAAYSHKGGTGKTTTMLMLANAIISTGKTALLVDCDPQANFARWKIDSLETHWPAGMKIVYQNYETTSGETLQEILTDADESNQFDYCLLNLPGLDHPFNQFVLRFAELTLIPFKPGATELVELQPAVDAIRRLEQEGKVGAIRILFTQTNGMTSAAKTYYRAAKDEFDHLAFETPANAIFEDLIMQGIIARVIGDNEGKVSGLDKVRLSRLKAALHDCETLLAECEQVISVEA